MTNKNLKPLIDAPKEPKILKIPKPKIAGIMDKGLVLEIYHDGNYPEIMFVDSGKQQVGEEGIPNTIMDRVCLTCGERYGEHRPAYNGKDFCQRDACVDFIQ